MTAAPVLAVPVLTERQTLALELLALGHGQQHIARTLGVSETYLRCINLRTRERLGARSNTHAVHLAHRLGMLDHLEDDRHAGVLSDRELRVLRLMAQGCPNSEIGRRLGRTEHVAAEVVRQVRRRLGARDRAHAVALGMASGLIRPAHVAGGAVFPQVAPEPVSNKEIRS